MATFLNVNVKWSGVLLALAILPWALPPFVNGILWKFVFFSGYGFLNKLLIGLRFISKPIEFLSSRWTLPLMKPFLAVGITSTSVTAINVFDEIVALSGYSDLGKNILMESYLTTFTFLNFGKGSAMTYIVMFFALILGIFYLRSLNKEVEY